jgi:FkbM family methyltransferase
MMDVVEFVPGAPEVIHVESETLDGVVDEAVELLKVDVEGYEPVVMDGAVKTMAQHVQNLVMEYTPGLLHSSA